MTIARDHFRLALHHTPFHERLRPLTLVEDRTNWNGYSVPRVVAHLSAEYFAVRSGCSVMDLTPMEKYRITGRDARAYLDRLVTRDLSRLRPGRVSYVVWCNDEGKVLDDGTLFQMGEQAYRLCAQHHQLDWLLLSARGFDVSIECETHDVAALAVQGPTAFSVLELAGITGLETLRPFDVAELTCGPIPVTVSRTGYTGDLGYELWLHPDNALALWDAIFGVRDRYDIRAIGLSALEMVRIEAGYVMPGFDFNTAESTIRKGFDRSPLEVGLERFVSFEKGHFTGRRALEAESRRLPARRLLRLVIDGNKPVGAAFLYDAKNGRYAGETRCAIWSPILKANLALAEIEYRKGRPPASLWARVEYQRELKWMTTWAECAVADQPFYQPEHRGLTPPDRY